jgi:hypothetical protein
MKRRGESIGDISSNVTPATAKIGAGYGRPCRSMQLKPCKIHSHIKAGKDWK